MAIDTLVKVALSGGSICHGLFLLRGGGVECGRLLFPSRCGTRRLINPRITLAVCASDMFRRLDKNLTACFGVSIEIPSKATLHYARMSIR